MIKDVILDLYKMSSWSTERQFGAAFAVTIAAYLTATLGLSIEASPLFLISSALAWVVGHCAARSLKHLFLGLREISAKRSDPEP